MLIFAPSKPIRGTKQQPQTRLLILCHDAKRYCGNRVDEWKHLQRHSSYLIGP